MNTSNGALLTSKHPLDHPRHAAYFAFLLFLTARNALEALDD